MTYGKPEETNELSEELLLAQARQILALINWGRITRTLRVGGWIVAEPLFVALVGALAGITAVLSLWGAWVPGAVFFFGLVWGLLASGAVIALRARVLSDLQRLAAQTGGTLVPTTTSREAAALRDGLRLRLQKGGVFAHNISSPDLCQKLNQILHQIETIPSAKACESLRPLPDKSLHTAIGMWGVFLVSIAGGLVIRTLIPGQHDLRLNYGRTTSRTIANATSPSPPDTTEHSVPFRGQVTSVDLKNNTITIATGNGSSRQLELSTNTVVKKDGEVSRTSEIGTNAQVTGSYWRHDDGTLEAKTVILKSTSTAAIGRAYSPQPSHSSASTLHEPATAETSAVTTTEIEAAKGALAPAANPLPSAFFVDSTPSPSVQNATTAFNESRTQVNGDHASPNGSGIDTQKWPELASPSANRSSQATDNRQTRDLPKANPHTNSNESGQPNSAHPEVRFSGIWTGIVRPLASASGGRTTFNVRISVNEGARTGRMALPPDDHIMNLSFLRKDSNRLYLRGRLPAAVGPATVNVTMEIKQPGSADATFETVADNGGWATLQGTLSKQ